MTTNNEKNMSHFVDGSGAQGICPCCGSENLTYGKVVDDDCGVAYPWQCDDCGAKGKETYEIDFVGHYNQD